MQSPRRFMAALSRHAAVLDFERFGGAEVAARLHAATVSLLTVGSKGPSMNFLFGRFGALTLACGLAMASGAAVAQTAPKPPPAAPAPAAAPPSGPVRLDLQPMQSPWTKICGKDQSSTKEVCYTTRDFGQAPDQPPTLAVAIYQMSGEEKRIARFLLPVALMLKPGFRLIIDKGEPIDGKFAICFPNGCFAEAELNGQTLATLKKAQTASVVVRNQGNNEVTFTLPMKDFGAAFDGAAVDPKQLEQQNQELQKQLADKAQREREQLEKQSAQPAPQAPVAPQPPK
jgi:invasion protein IalB